MSIERSSGGSSLVDVLDRVLDKGIVIDAVVRLSLVGFEIIRVEARVVVASIRTFLEYAVAVGELPGIPAQPLLAEGVSLPALAGNGARRDAHRRAPRD